jgi:hypothetical protein
MNKYFKCENITIPLPFYSAIFFSLKLITKKNIKKEKEKKE